MKLRNKRTAGVIGAAVLMVTMSAAPSHAAEKIGTPVSGPGGSCADGFVANSHVKVCWMRDGDRLYVYDGAKDGRSAYGVTSFSNVPCRNKNGVGTWVYCVYNMPEGWNFTYVGYTQDNEGIFNRQMDLTGEGSDHA